MKILLVNPTTSSQTGFLKYAVFPYGILFLAAVMEKEGHEVEIYDNNIDNRRPEDFTDFCPDLIGFSVLTGRSIENAVLQAKKFREILPKAKIVWGGVHPTLLPEQTVREPYIDWVVVGEGEQTLLQLIQLIHEKRSNLKDIKGLVYKENGNVIKNEPRPFIKELDTLPDPAWHLVDVGKYSEITLNTSRGCPFRCTFCYNQAFNQKRRSEFSPERILSWIELLQNKYDATSFKFYEDNFTINRIRLREFCKLIIQKNLKIKWNCESRVHLNEEEIILMARSGCMAIGIGVESGSPRMLEFLKKDIKLEEVGKTCSLLAKHKIGPGLYVMIGLPRETVEDFKLTLNMLKKLDYMWLEYMVYRPYPGTVLYDFCLENDLFKPPEKLIDWANFSDLYDLNNTLSNIPSEMLKKGMRNFRIRYPLMFYQYRLKYDTANLIYELLNPLKTFKKIINFFTYYINFFIRIENEH